MLEEKYFAAAPLQKVFKIQHILDVWLAETLCWAH